jgi:hypothetical protein
MGQKFYFFTDPALLVQQTPAQAYGPQGVVNGKDIYQITDVHTATAKAAAFAVCDGLVAAQYDDSGTISIILKPTHQPPFDFPFISYFIYKGIDPASLLGSDGRVDTSQTTNDLVSAIKKAWELPDNNNSATKPSKNCLGLHLNPTAYLLEYPNDQNQTRFASDKPIENLFYEGDPNFQMTPLKAGNRIGTFTAAGFGFEIVLERMSYRPHTGLSRKFKNLIEVDTLDTSVNYAPDDTPYFMHWHEKEDCLNFIDPCAFWGAFVSASIQVWDSVGGKFKKRTGNETGQSINYYKARGPMIQLALDPEADMDASQVNYYGSGWPLLILENPALPTGTSGTSAEIRYAIPKSGPAETVLFVCAGYGKKLRGLKDKERFPSTYRRANSNYLKETVLVVPLAADSSTYKVLSCYIKIFAFQSHASSTLPQAGTSISGLIPAHLSPIDLLFRVVPQSFFSLASLKSTLRTFDEYVLIEPYKLNTSTCVANIAVMFDNTHVILAFIPKFYIHTGDVRNSNTKTQLWESMSTSKETAFEVLHRKVGDVESYSLSNGFLLVERVAQKTAGEAITSHCILAMSRQEFDAIESVIIEPSEHVGSIHIAAREGDVSYDAPVSFRTYHLDLKSLQGAQALAWNTSSVTLTAVHHVPA